MENEIIVIRTGFSYLGEHWEGMLNGYFKSAEKAEQYLTKEGYEYYRGDIYSKDIGNENGKILLAKIDGLSLIAV